MKKISILIFLLLLLPLLSSIDFDIGENFAQGETMVTKISGNFIEPILKENIYFYRGHVRVPMEFDLAKINDEFYIYALLPETQNNYSLTIKNLKYYSGSKTSENDLTKNFSIINQTADFSISPGFIIADKDFFVNLQNLQNEKIEIQLSDERTISLKSGEKQRVYFEAETIKNENLDFIEFSSKNTKYEIPINIFSEKESENITLFKLEPSNLNINLSTDSENSFIIYLYNIGNKELENVELSVSESLTSYVSLVTDSLDKIGENSNAKIELQILSGSEEKIIEGQIKAKSSNVYAYSSVKLSFIPGFIPSGDEIIITTTKTCVELKGIICEENQICEDETPTYAKDDICCLSKCTKIKTSSFGKIIGWLILIVVLGFLIWFYLRNVKKK